MHHTLGQVPHHQLQQQQIGPQQQTHLVTGHGIPQYVSPVTALQGTIPPAFHNVQQPAMYSYEDLQMFQRGIPHLAPTTSLPGARDGSITSPAAYSAPDAGKFRTDQNSSPVPSTISQQAATAGGTYLTATGNAGIPPFYMYHNMAVPSSFPQYGHPAFVQLPANTHTGSTTTQFPGPPKLPYGGTSNYYENMSQAYEKQGFHSGIPPPFNLTGSGSNPMAANAYGPAIFFSTVPGAQHHSPLMHHQLHQDGTNANNQRGGAVGDNQNKATSKSGYTGSYWGSN